MYRAYIRTFDGRVPVETKTVTADQGAAIAAFSALVGRTELDGHPLAAALTHNNRQIAFHRFDRRPGDLDYWRDRLHELPALPRNRLGADERATAYLARYRWPDEGVQAMTAEQLHELMRCAFVAGFEQGRNDLL